MLRGQARVFKHGKAQTLYVAIPSSMARDSAFTIKMGDIVRLEWFPSQQSLVIQKK